jgi:hypothetical protein
MIDILTMNAGRLISLQRVTYVVLDEVCPSRVCGSVDASVPFLVVLARRIACLTWDLSPKFPESSETPDQTGRP